MGISFKIALVGVGAFALFVTLSVSIQRWIVYPQFEVLQDQDAKHATERLLAAVDRETRSLAAFCADYAEWDDTWAYVDSLDPGFIASSFAQSAFTHGNFEMVWIIRADGAVLYHAALSRDQDTLEETVVAAGERILEGHPFLKPLATGPIRGIVPTPQGVALVAAHPILTSGGEGPPRGVLVMGRRLDPAFAAAMGEQVRLPVRVGDLRELPPNARPEAHLRHALASGELETTVFWNDWFGQPAFSLALRSPPDITVVGRRALMQSVVAVVAQGMLFLLIGGWLASRVSRRAREVELARLLDERTAALGETEQYLKTIMDTTPVAILVVDAELHTILDANPAALTLVGASREVVVGQVCHKFVCPAERGRCPISDLGRTCDRLERELLRADGSSIPVLKTVVLTHLRGRDCLLECFVDIRDQKAAGEKIRQTAEDMGRMNRAMVGREARVLELKAEVNGLLRELGRASRYHETPAPAPAATEGRTP